MQAGGTVGKVAEAEGYGDGVEGTVGKGEFQGIGFGQLGKAPIPCLGKQWAGEVETYDLGLWEGFPENNADIPGATGEIKDLGRVLAGNGGNQLFSPANVHAEAEKTVESIVVG